MPPTLKNLLGTEGVPFFTPSPAHPRPHGPQLFFFVHLSFFSESRINSIFDVRRLPREVGGTLAWRAPQTEEPDSRGHPAQSTLSPPGAPSRWRRLRPRRSCSLRAGAREAKSGMRWRPGLTAARELRVPTRFPQPALGSVTASAETCGAARVRACGRLGRQPRRPARRRRSSAPAHSSPTPAPAPPGLPARSNRPLDNGGQFARTPIASISGARGYVRADGPGGRGPREAGKLEGQRPRAHGHRRVGGPRWAPGPSPPASPRTRTHPGAVGGPRIYIFSSLGAGVRFCILMRS